MAAQKRLKQAILPPEQAIHALHPEVPKNGVLHALRERVK